MKTGKTLVANICGVANLILVMLLLIFSTNIFASESSVESRLAELENRTQVLEQAVKERLSDCEMVYKAHNVRTNRCDKGTFARGATHVGNGVINFECGYYQLSCKK